MKEKGDQSKAKANMTRFWNPNDFTSGNLFNKHITMLETNPNAMPYGSFGSFTRLKYLQYMAEYGQDTEFELS